jgi:4'-phosphopantetheinyl transferase
MERLLRPTSADVWSRGSLPAVLKKDEIHVWSARLNGEMSRWDCPPGLLSCEERATARRFYCERDRRRYMAAHGVLRLILAGYLRTRPEELRFRRGRHGKPYLDEAEGNASIHFNLSHTEDLVLCSLVREQEIGIDAERIRPIRATEQIVSSFFTPCERRYLASLNREQRRKAFLHGWTRKEAFLKALGGGLSLGLDGVSVPLASCTHGTWLRLETRLDRSGDWHACELGLGEAYVAALAIRGRDWNVKCWCWPEGAGPG